MCIRDRDFVPIKQVAINVLEKIEDAYKNQGTVTGIPVSYTHLDVYKRQTGELPSERDTADRGTIAMTPLRANLARSCGERTNIGKRRRKGGRNIFREERKRSET